MKKSKLAILSTALLLAVATGCIPQTSTSSSSTPEPSTSTSTVDTKQEALNEAAEFLYQANKENNVNTADYKLPAKQMYDGVLYDVEWEFTYTSGPQTAAVLGEKGADNYYTVAVVYNPVDSTEDLVYTIKAKLTDSEGRVAYSKEISKTVPAFAFTAHADYLSAKDDTLLNVEGYIVGRYPLYNGKTSVFLQSANGEGYYVYNMAVTEEQMNTDIVLGNYIIVSGAKDTYSGTAEIVNATYQLSQKADVTVEPYDITELFTSASSVAAEELIKLQGSLVTIKGVTLTTYTESNSYLNFTKDGKNSYVRISSSGNCSDFDATAKDTLKGNYPSKFGYEADVTGIVAQYSGNFYLMPTSKDSIKVTGTTMSPAFAVDYAASNLDIGTTVLSNLPTTVEGTGTEITWTSSVEGLFAADGTFTAPAEPKTATLTATIKSGEATATKEFKDVLVIKPEADSVATIEAAISALESGSTTSSVYVLEGTVVAKDNSNRPYVMDKDGDVLLVYEKLASLEVGEKVKLYGIGKNYFGLYQLTNAKIIEESNTTVAFDCGFPTTMTPAEFTAATATPNTTLNGQYIRIPGLKITSGQYINFEYDDNGTAKTIQSYAKHDLLVAENAGKTVTVYGYFYGTSSSGEAKFVASEIVEGIDEEPVPPVATSKVTFDLGANGEENHVDGNDLGATYTLESGSNKLELTEMSKVYGPAYDAKGNSCIKLGTSSKVGTFTFTVSADVTKVTIYVARYKYYDNSKITVNGTEYTLTKNSNDGEYEAIVVDTTTNKTVVLSTVSGNCRCMINTIEVE